MCFELDRDDIIKHGPMFYLHKTKGIISLCNPKIGVLFGTSPKTINFGYNFKPQL